MTNNDPYGAAGPQQPQQPQPQPYPQQQASYPQGQYPPAQYGGPSAPNGQPGTSGKGLFGAMFDLSFRHFATPKIVTVAYILVMIAIGLGALAMIIGAFAMMGSREAATGFILLIATPVVALLYLAIARMTLEMYVAITRTAEEIGRLNDTLNRR